MQSTPRGEIVYNEAFLAWLSPALEYYGDMGAIAYLPGCPANHSIFWSWRQTL